MARVASSVVARLAMALLVGGGDVVPAACGLRRALDVLGALLVGRRDLEGREVALERLGGVLEPGLVEAGDLAEELELRVRVLLVARA